MKEKLNFYSMLIRREIWENKGLLIKTPLILAGILVVLSLFGTFNIVKNDHAADISDWHQTFNMPEKKDNHIVLQENKNLALFFYLPALIISFVLAFMYLTQSLYSDRKDRSIFFWRSLPIRESESVLIKLLVATFVYPIIFCLVTTVALVISTIIAYVGAMTINADGIIRILVLEIQSYSIVGIFRFILNEIIAIVLFLPLFTWPLFCSAFAKRAPFIMALFFPLAVFFAEFMAFKTMYSLNHIKVFLMQQSMNLHAIVDGRFGSADGTSIVVSLFLSAAMIGAAIWLRNNRFEI